jgi:hypothetical protein
VGWGVWGGGGQEIHSVIATSKAVNRQHSIQHLNMAEFMAVGGDLRNVSLSEIKACCHIEPLVNIDILRAAAMLL